MPFCHLIRHHVSLLTSTSYSLFATCNPIMTKPKPKAPKEEKPAETKAEDTKMDEDKKDEAPEADMVD